MFRVILKFIFKIFTFPFQFVIFYKKYIELSFMRNRFNPFVALLIFTLIGLSLSDRLLQKSTYATTASRTSSVKESCGGYDRDELVVK